MEFTDTIVQIQLDRQTLISTQTRIFHASKKQNKNHTNIPCSLAVTLAQSVHKAQFHMYTSTHNEL